MMCQRMGRPPTSTSGFGRYSVSSRSRVPCPPHKITTFILIVRRSRYCERHRGGARQSDETALFVLFVTNGEERGLMLGNDPVAYSGAGIARCGANELDVRGAGLDRAAGDGDFFLALL